MQCVELRSLTGTNNSQGIHSPYDLHLSQRQAPQPRPGHVVVHIKAASLNYRDLMVADGRYGRPPLPLVPLSDAAGEIISTGQHVSSLQPGDRVAGTFFQGWIDGPLQRQHMDRALGGTLDGVAAEFVEFPADGLVRIPDHLTDVEAATLPCAALTAWNAIAGPDGVRPDQTVLIQGTGGVALFALQFAKMQGARVILLSGSESKLERARALGADALLNYRTTPDWSKDVFELTERVGVDHVVEVGGRDTLQKSLRALAFGGRIHLIGGVSGFSSELSLLDIIGKAAHVRGIYVGNRSQFEAMNRALRLHKSRPVIDRVLPFSAIADAYDHLAGGSHFGKVVLSGW